MIFFFSGTGNSRYLAHDMAKRLDDTVVDVAMQIKAGKHPHFVSEKPLVFVSPVYAWRMPRVLERWIAACTFQGTDMAYFLLTCGDSIGAAAPYAAALAKKKNLAYMGTAQVIMPENYIAMFNPPPPEADAGMFKAARAQTSALCTRIAAHRPFDQLPITFLGHLCSDVVTPFFYRFSVSARKFRVQGNCISCGACVSNCMLNNIQMKDGKPIWGKHCTHCMACISKCPTEAIEYGKRTVGLRRYVCSAKDETEN